MDKLHLKKHALVTEEAPLPKNFKSGQASSPVRNMLGCGLYIDNPNGLIFSSAAISVTGVAKFPIEKTGSYSIVIFDLNSHEIQRIGLNPVLSGEVFECSFSWDLKSKSNSYAESGCYTISLARVADEEEIRLCSVECRVADTRNILRTTDLLKSSQKFTDPICKQVLSIYADIIRDIEIRIIEGLKDNQFDEPYFVASTTAGFIQQIYDDIENDSVSMFRPLIEDFVSKNPCLRLQTRSKKLGLRRLFNFLVNYMADPEDRTRASAMINCEYRNFTAKDRRIILSALVSGILPHCVSSAPSTSLIANKTYTIFENFLKFGIRYICAIHIDKSISICRETLR